MSKRDPRYIAVYKTDGERHSRDNFKTFDGACYWIVRHVYPLSLMEYWKLKADGCMQAKTEADKDIYIGIKKR